MQGQSERLAILYNSVILLKVLVLKAENSGLFSPQSQQKRSLISQPKLFALSAYILQYKAQEARLSFFN